MTPAITQDIGSQAVGGRRSRVSASHITRSLVRAVLEGRLQPGTRIGEEELCAVFQVSRTPVRQALTQLASQGVVAVKPKKGWFVVEPSEREMREVFATRRLIETAMTREFMRAATKEQLSALKQHLQQQFDAVAHKDVAERTHLLADFHVRIAHMTGNRVLARILEDLTVRTSLISMLYQTHIDATHSADEHAEILAAIESGDMDVATRLMDEHLSHVEAGLQVRKNSDPVHLLHETLAVDHGGDTAHTAHTTLA